MQPVAKWKRDHDADNQHPFAEIHKMKKFVYKKPEPASKLPMIIGGVVFAAAIAAGLNYFADEAAPRPMEVEVYMNKRCEMIDGAFIAVSEPDGARANFDKGLAILKTYSNSKIMVRSNPAYPSFSYESNKVQAEPKVVISVECETGRIDKTLDAMRQQFRSRER